MMDTKYDCINFISSDKMLECHDFGEQTQTFPCLFRISELLKIAKSQNQAQPACLNTMAVGELQADHTLSLPLTDTLLMLLPTEGASGSYPSHSAT